MAQKLKQLAGITVNVLGANAPTTPMPSMLQQLLDEKILLQHSLTWFEQAGDTGPAAHCRRQLAALQAQINHLRHGTCPVCGQAHSHDWRKCAQEATVAERDWRDSNALPMGMS